MVFFDDLRCICFQKPLLEKKTFGGVVSHNKSVFGRTCLQKQEKYLYLLFGSIIAGLIAAGFSDEGILPVLTRFIYIQTHPARLISDYTLIGSPGSALVNAALVGAVGLIMTRITNIRLSGPTTATIFTMIGFGLFGKTPLNIAPIMIGVYLSAKIAGKKFREYLIIALFGTALGPVVTFIVAEAGFFGWPALFAGMGAGIVVGMILPAIAIAMLRLHQGFNLYNIGLTAGFLALFAAAILAAAGNNIGLTIHWNRRPSYILIWLIPVIAFILLIAGFLFEGPVVMKSWFKILKLSGRLPSDFMEMVSPGGAVINMGIMGLLCWGYVMLTGGDFNGPVLGGILTVMGFASFGKHPKNALPVMAGAVVAALVFGKSLSAPGPLLAVLFCTTLAPLSGEFGIPLGFVAGFLHLTLVERTAPWHGGMDLYNNGFAGGLTATFIVAVIEWFQSSRGDTFWGERKKYEKTKTYRGKKKRFE